MIQETLLPYSWVWTTLGEIAELAGGGTPSRKNPEYFTGNILWLTPTEIPKNRISIVSNSKEKITQQALKKSSARVLPKGTVLMTSRASIGYVAIAGTEVTTNQGFANFICKEGICNYYLAYWLLSNAEFYKQQATGTTFKEIIKAKLRTFPIPLPPLSEQERIVATIEELFTQLEAGTAALRRVQAGLKRYKASVLKTACEGRLVEQDPSDEPAEELLRRLGKSPLVSEDLPSLPVGWCWVKVGDISDHRLGKMLDKEKNKGELRPYLRNINVRWFRFDLSDIQYMRVMDNELDNISVKKNDLVVCEGGEPGRAAVWNKNEPVIIQKALHRVRPVDGVLPTYLALCLAADANNGRLEKYFTGSTIKHFTGESLHVYTIPLPPLTEQHRIVAEVERRLSVISEVEAVVKAGLMRSERLRQAILKRAFEGKLVAQDPEAEPAKVLLERIRTADNTPAKAAVKQARLC